MDRICKLSAAPHTLLEDDDGRLVLAASDGLLTWHGDALKTVHTGSTHSAARGPDGRIYCTDGEGLFCVTLDDTDERTTVAPDLGGAPSGRRQVTCTPDGAIWVEGCTTRLQLDGTFLEVPPTPVGATPAPCSLDIYGNYWSLVDTPAGRQVLVLPANAPSTWQPAWLAAGAWDHLLADSVGCIWVAGPSGWRRFCPRRMNEGWQTVEGDLPGRFVTAMALSPDDLVMAAFATGEILELDTDAAGQLQTRTLATIDEAAHCILTTRDGAIWAATPDGLYREKPAADAWQRRWEKKRGRLPGGGNHDVFSVECQGKLYVAGGWAGEWGLPPDRHVLDELFAYNPRSEYWQIVSRMIIPRRYCGIAEMGDQVWVVGGETRIPGWPGEGQVLYTVDIYDPASDTWSPAPSLNVARTDPFVVSHGGRIWAIGGAAHNSGPKLDSVESIGPGEDAWRMETSLPEPTRQGHACALGDVIYCASIDGMYAFDTATGQWDEDFPQPGEIGQGPLAAAYEGEVWLMGGHGDQSIRCYNPSTRSWRQGPDLPTEQAWAAAAVMNGELIIVGGAHGSPRHEATVFDDRTYVLRKTSTD